MDGVAAEKKVWLNYTQAELNNQYNQRYLVPNADEYAARNVADSAKTRAKLECRLDVSYGPHPDQRLDIFPAAKKGAPVVVFIHGGAWTRSSKESNSYVAETFVPAGIHFVAVEFGLCPKVTLDELVRHNRAAIQWVYRNAREFGADPEKLYVAGHSSGGHVTGMMVVTDWARDWGLPANVIKSALAGSGMYDLEPVRLSSRNEYLKLDVEAARRNSSIIRIPANGCPLVVCYGEGEQKEFRRQSIEFAAAWRAKGLVCKEFDLPKLNHFEVGQEYANPKAPFMKAFLEMVGA
jgi:arylformamidase